MKREFHVWFCEGLGVKFPRPTRQHFTGETFFQHKPPIHPSSLSRWRDRIGEDGAEWLLTKTIEAGRAAGTVDDASLKRVAVDTTVMEK